MENSKKEKLKCEQCRGIFHKEELIFFDGEFWCCECLGEYTTVCDDCGERIYTDDASYVNDDYPICNRCYDDNYFYCDRCERIYHNEHRSGNLCAWCCEDEESPEAAPNNERYYFKSRRDLPVGVEIEAEDGDYMDVYDELTPKGFGVAQDGSLKRNGFKISRRCGLHIHIEFPSRKKTVKRLMLMAYACEPILYAVNPKSRRSNSFCKPLSSAFKIHEILTAESEQIDQLFYSKGNGHTTKQDIKSFKTSKWNACRYFGFNIHSLFYRNTVEFRYHAGTIEPQKIISWVKLLRSILLYVRYTYDKFEVLGLIEQPTVLGKLKYLSNMLKLSGSLTPYFLNRYIKFNKTLCAA